MLGLFRRIDERLLADYPQAWAMKIHHVLAAGIPGTALFFLAACIYPVAANNIPDVNRVHFPLSLIPSLLFSSWWLYTQGRDRSRAAHTRKKRAEIMLTILGSMICLIVIFAPPFAYSGTLLYRESRLMDKETLERDFERYNGFYVILHQSRSGCGMSNKPIDFEVKAIGQLLEYSLSAAEREEIEEKIRGLSGKQRKGYAGRYTRVRKNISRVERMKINQIFGKADLIVTEREWEAAKELYSGLSAEEREDMYFSYYRTRSGEANELGVSHGNLAEGERTALLKGYAELKKADKAPEFQEYLDSIGKITSRKSARSTSPGPRPPQRNAHRPDMEIPESFNSYLKRVTTTRMRLQSGNETTDFWMTEDDLKTVGLIYKNLDWDEIYRNRTILGMVYLPIREKWKRAALQDHESLRKEQLGEIHEFLAMYSRGYVPVPLTLDEFKFESSRDNKVSLKAKMDEAGANLLKLRIKRQDLPALCKGVVVAYVGIAYLVAFFLCILTLIPVRHLVISVVILVVVFIAEVFSLAFIQDYVIGYFHERNDEDYFRYNFVPWCFMVFNLVLYLGILLSLASLGNQKRQKFFRGFTLFTASVMTNLVPFFILILIMGIPSEAVRDSFTMDVVNNFVSYTWIMMVFAGPALFLCVAPFFEKLYERFYSLPE